MALSEYKDRINKTKKGKKIERVINQILKEKLGYETNLEFVRGGNYHYFFAIRNTIYNPAILKALKNPINLTKRNKNPTMLMDKLKKT